MANELVSSGSDHDDVIIEGSRCPAHFQLRVSVVSELLKLLYQRQHGTVCYCGITSQFQVPIHPILFSFFLLFSGNFLFNQILLAFIAPSSSFHPLKTPSPPPKCLPFGGRILPFSTDENGHWTMWAICNKQSTIVQCPFSSQPLRFGKCHR
jgi:hypothetical protein